jgi:biotin operon repressor
MSRPSQDDPVKYDKALRAYQLATHKSGVGTGAKKIEDFAELFSWAIAQAQPGFQEGEVIGIAAAAEGLRSSRSTINQAVDRLLRQGLVVLETPKSPYRIVSRAPVLHPDWLASATISATSPLKEQGGASVIAEPLWIQIDDNSAYAEPLRQALSVTSDKAIKASLATPECRQRWYQARVLVFRRLRFMQHEEAQRGWLHEVTYIALPPEVEHEVEERIHYLREKNIRMVSLSSLLSFAAIKQLTNGRTRIALGSIDHAWSKDLTTLARQHEIDVSPLLGSPRKPAPLLRWEYGHFAAKPVGLVAFSICHEDPAQIHLFARDLNLVNPTS